MQPPDGFKHFSIGGMRRVGLAFARGLHFFRRSHETECQNLPTEASFVE
jgi:hypothetical protein